MRTTLLILAAVLIAACGRPDYDHLAKAAASATAGAFIGYTTVGRSSGTLAAALGFGTAGALISFHMTGHLPLEDAAAMRKTGYDSLTDSASGVASNWHNPKTGNSGSFTPETAYLTDDGILCRNYTATLTVRGETEQIRRTACRTGIGSWTPVADASS